MSNEGNNLLEILLGDFKRRQSVIVTSSRKGTDLVHGRAVVHIRSSLKHSDLVTSSGRRSCRIAVAEKSLILLGTPDEFGADAVRLLSKAGYPFGFEVIRKGGNILIYDGQQEEGRSLIATSEEHVGLVFWSRANDLSGRPTMMLAGTTPLGILAAALWVTQSVLADIPVPPDFPRHPIEALVRVLKPGHALPDLCDLETELTCGTAVYDPHRREWKEKAPPVPIEKERRTQIRIEMEAGIPRFIHVGKRVLRVTEADRPQLLLLLIQRSKQGLWTTMAEAQKLLDQHDNPKKVRTLAARRSEIARMSEDPFFMEKHSRADGTDAFRLRADIVFVDIGATANPLDPL